MMIKRALVAISVCTLMAGCAGIDRTDPRRGLVPQTDSIVAASESVGSTRTAPALIRLFKEERALELWKQRKDGTYALVRTYAICAYSGELGPKRREGDRQAPEGFYSVGASQLNPLSIEYLSFNTGYPNAYDRSLGRTGAALMIHGGCSSRGCYAINDDQMAELYAVMRDALRAGQASIQLQIYPFRMTAANMAKHASNPNKEFWLMLKPGYDRFEATRRPLDVSVVGSRYVIR